MTNERLAEIATRCEAATPSPWVSPWNMPINASDSIVAGDKDVVSAGWHDRPILCVTKQDAEFIAHAREDVPALLNEVIQLRNANRWIPIDERLPEAEDRVIVWTAHEHGGYVSVAFFEDGNIWSSESAYEWDGNVFYCDDSAIYDDKRDAWKIPKGWHSEEKDGLYGVVTHWQPLPAGLEGGKYDETKPI